MKNTLFNGFKLATSHIKNIIIFKINYKMATRFKMLNSLLIINFALTITLSFGQDYPYTRIDKIAKYKLTSAIFETRNSDLDTFYVQSHQIAEYSHSCQITKITSYYRNFNTNILQEERKDSFAYTNGRLVAAYYFIEKKLNYSVNFSTSIDNKIDTSYFQDVDGQGNLRPNNSKSILYRNKFGFDSLYKSYALINGALILHGGYFEYIYDNKGRIIKGRYGGYGNNVFKLNRIEDYTYTGNNLTLLTTSYMNQNNSDTTINFIRKTDYTYNSLGQEISNTLSTSSVTNINDFIPLSRLRKTVLNSKGNPTESFFDSWSGNTWIRSYQNKITYINDSLFTLQLAYTLVNSNWVLKEKYNVKYCETVNRVNDVNSFDIKLYPNPANNNINLASEFIDNSSGDITIFDSTGRLIFQKKGVIFPYVHDISSYLNGFYIIKINNSNSNSNTILKKFIIVH